MTMSIKEIKAYLIENRILDNPEVNLLGRGEANLNYLAVDHDRKYVVRIARNDVPKQSGFETERHFMLFIESLGVISAPRSIHYSSKYELHVVDYVEGKDVSIVDLNEVQTNIFVDQLKLLNSITYEQYLAWCSETGYTPLKPQSLVFRNKININDRLSTIRNLAHTDLFAKKVLVWAESKIDTLYAAQRQATLRLTFLHDDLRWNEGGGNIKVSDGKLTFIDWELSGFFEEAAPEISDVLGSIPSTVDSAIARRLYRSYIKDGSNIDELNSAIKYGILWGRLGNPLWAAERYCILRHDNHPEIERYRILAERGMKDAESFFKEPLNRWFSIAKSNL